MRVQFADFTFDAAAQHLRRKDRSVPLPDKAVAVLHLLLAHRPHLVTKEELLRRVWPDKPVEEANLSIAVAQLRRALEDDAQQPHFIKTHFGRGYAFVGDAIDLDVERRDATPTRAGSRFWLVWNDRRFVLFEGENLVGRSPRSVVWLDVSRVSGTHALITVSGSVVTIADLKSTNGTYLRGAQVTSPQVLADKDVIRFGTTDLTFREYRVETERVDRRGTGSRSRTRGA